MKKKVNPRRRPVSQADVDRAKSAASDQAVHLVLAIMLTVLKDKFDFDNDQIVSVWNAVNKLSEEVAEKRVSKRDLVTVLSEEYNIDLS